VKESDVYPSEKITLNSYNYHHRDGEVMLPLLKLLLTWVKFILNWSFSVLSWATWSLAFISSISYISFSDVNSRFISDHCLCSSSGREGEGKAYQGLNYWGVDMRREEHSTAHLVDFQLLSQHLELIS